MVYWRKWLRILHRDIGYIAAGLTVIYAISGIAVNHVADWNPNYKIQNFESQIEPIADSLIGKEGLTQSILDQIGEKGKVKDVVYPDSSTMSIFVEDNTITVHLKTGLVEEEKVQSRTGIRETNFLHLNVPKKLWTWVADIFAVALLFLAISGLFMIKGKQGITGRGAWLTALGILIPVVFLIVYYYMD
ncbi:MAG: PepSY-associated TM helix domain-containing protein [Ignavibacteriales bacterium]|nr:PepSY-associated TM helix domain-containing protein [Ignavibacteriales bacterium]